MNRLRYEFQRFMQGRYGADELYRFLFIVYVILFLINCFVHSRIISGIIWLLLIYSLFRLTSKNISARHKENVKYLLLRNKIKIHTDRIKDRQHIYRRCPYCKVTLRFPRKKGKHTANCPKCNKAFNVNVWF